MAVRLSTCQSARHKLDRQDRIPRRAHAPTRLPLSIMRHTIFRMFQRLRPMSGSSDGQLEQNAQKVVEFHELLDRMTFWVPRGNDIATIKGIQTLHGEEKTKFVLMRWIQGGIDAYITNAGNTSVFPFLPLREIKGTALSWDFLMGTLPKPGLGGSVSIGDIPPELCRCGRFRIDITTGNWKFNLNSRQVISQESTNNGRWPVRIGIPVTL